MLRDRKLAEEWRLFYVACTAPGRRLVCSAAHWYPGPAEPQGPSRLLRVRVRPTPISSPSASATTRPRSTPRWPPGSGSASGERPSLRSSRWPSDHAPAVARRHGAVVDCRTTARPRRPRCRSPRWCPTRRCPKQFYWSVVRPLPRRPSQAARLGTEVHRWIELRSGNQLALIEPEAELDARSTPMRSRSDGRRPSSCRSRSSRQPVRGRSTRGGWRRRSCSHCRPSSFVGASTPCTSATGASSWSTSRPGGHPPKATPPPTCSSTSTRVAAVDTWRDDPSSLRTTYCYLRTDGAAELVSRDWSAAVLARVRDELGTGCSSGSERDVFDVNPVPCVHALRLRRRVSCRSGHRPRPAGLTRLARVGPVGLLLRLALVVARDAVDDVDELGDDDPARPRTGPAWPAGHTSRKSQRGHHAHQVGVEASRWSRWSRPASSGQRGRGPRRSSRGSPARPRRRLGDSSRWCAGRRVDAARCRPRPCRRGRAATRAAGSPAAGGRPVLKSTSSVRPSSRRTRRRCAHEPRRATDQDERRLDPRARGPRRVSSRNDP